MSPPSLVYKPSSRFVRKRNPVCIIRPEHRHAKMQLTSDLEGAFPKSGGIFSEKKQGMTKQQEERAEQAKFAKELATEVEQCTHI
jgi:hypothetical protein